MSRDNADNTRRAQPAPEDTQRLMAEAMGRPPEEIQRRPPAPRRAPPRRRTPADMLDGLKDGLLLLERNLAGYVTTSGALATLTGTLPEGERQRGAPLLRYAASVNGKDAVEVVLDVGDVPEEVRRFFLGAMIHAHARGIQRSLGGLAAGVDELNQSLAAALTPAAAPAGAGPAGGEHAPEEESEDGDEDDE